MDSQKPPTGIFRAPSAVDGVVRITAYRRLLKYPLVVQVALAEDELLGPVAARRNMTIAIGAVVSTGLLAALFLIMRLERRQQRLTKILTDHEEQLQKTLAELERLATTESTDGPAQPPLFL